MAAADTAPANTSVPAFWNADPDPLPKEAPEAGAAVPPLAAKRAAAQPTSSTPAFWDAEPDKIEEPAAPAAPTQKPHEYAFLKGFVGQSNRLLTLLGRAAGQSGEGLAAGEGAMSPEEAAAAHQEFYKQFVEPTVENQARFELPPDASMSDKVFHGFGSTAAMIAQAIASGGAAGGATTEALGGGLAVRAAGGAVTMTVPAAANAVEIGHQVLAETGDKHAAMTAGVTAYLVNAASGAIPMGVGGRLATRIATAGAAGAGLQEAGRLAQNAAMPEGMQQPFSPADDLTAMLTTAPFGLLPHGGGAHPVREVPGSLMDHAQQTAAAHEAAQGGDALNQVVAATQAEAHVGGLHDAVDTEASRLEEQGHLENAMQAHRVEAAKQEMENTEAQLQQGQTDQQVEGAYKQKAAQDEADKEANFAAAKNQAGEQEVEASKTAEAGAEKGGANEPGPTLADADQQGVLQQLKARMTVGRPAEEAAPTETKPVGDEDVVPLPPLKAKREATAPPEAAAPEGSTEPTEVPGEEALPEKGPPAPTPQTLAERRQAALDAKMAAKVSGEPAAPAEETPPAPATPEAPIAAPRASNRLAAIRAAAEKRQLPPAAQSLIDELRAGVAKSKAAEAEEPKPQFAAARPSPLTNNASGESAASQEAINRGSRNLDLVDPDGNATPVMRGVDQADRNAPPGHLIVDRDTGETVSRGKGLNDLGERGLKARYQAKKGGAQFASPIAQDVGNALRPSKDEVTQAVKGITDRLGPNTSARLTIHHDDSTIPPDLKADGQGRGMYGPNGELPRGVYDPKTNTAHVIAQGHQDVDDATRTAVHELTHFGNRNVLGPDYDSTMQNIHDHLHDKPTDIPSADTSKTDKVTARQWVRDYAEQHGMDLKDPAVQKHVADEYTAHLADQDFSDPNYKTPGVLKYLWSQMRAAFRKMGLNVDWSDNDLRVLRQRISSHLGDFRSDIAERNALEPPRWAAARKAPEPGLPPSDPESIAAKFGKSMEEQADSGPNTLRSRGDFARAAGAGLKNTFDRADVKTMAGRLAFLHMDSLPDIVRDMKTPREFQRTTQQMVGRSGRLMDEGNALALQWSRWANGGIFKDPNSKRNFSLTMRSGQADGGKALRDQMHGDTIAGVDPSREYRPAFTGDLTPEQQAAETARQAYYKQSKAAYDKIDPEGREIYNKVRDYYMDRRADVLRGLEARIAETGADENSKKQLMTELRQKFEGGLVKGPYFPLARFGNHWGVAKNPDTGEYAFSRFEDPIQRKRWLQRAKDAGLDTDQGSKKTDRSLMERVDPDFVKKVMDATQGNKELQDEIWQHYLKSMPEMSMRKSLIHRKNILGYSEDALRAFAYNAFHSAHQIARLEYGNRLDAITNRMGEEADHISNTQPDSKNAFWAPAVANEFQKRLEWIKNPRASATASSLTKFGFGWYIGASPATAIRISTQNAMLAEPYLGAKASKWGLGYNAGRGELWKAVGEWSKTSLNPLGKSNLGDSLRGNEREMFDELRARGTFSSTSAQTLASGGADRPIGVGPLDAFTRASSFMFNAMEHKNRMTTALAAYRLAIRGGLPHEEAIEEANDASNKAHFNYNNYNRPRVLQNDFAKVAGLFKQYPWQVTDRLARSFRDGVLRNPELSDADKNEQLKAFAGYMGKMMLFAGIKGVPILYHATMAAINGAFGTEDKPFDAQAAMREHLEQHIGKTGADAVMDGPMSALTGAALSSGASYADLWYKQPARDMTWGQQMGDLLGQLAGPVYGSLPAMGVGADIIHQGDTERGLEHMTPPAVNHLMKAWRLGSEGATNLRGEQVVSPEELGQGYSAPLVGLQAVRQKNLLLQALGFSPEVVARQYEKNTSAQNFKEEVTKRQQFLNEQYDNAVLRGNNEDAIKWMQQMQQFHKENPGVPWSAKGIENGIRSRAKAVATANHGVNMAPGMAQEYNQMTGGQP